MDYSRIISFGFSRAWKHKSLWILGFFISGGGGGGNIFNIGSKSDSGDFGDIYVPGIVERILENPLIILALVAAVLAVIIIFIILGTISIGGLIEAARRFKQNEVYRLGEVFKVGVSYFWRLLGITILVLVVMAAFILMLILFGVAAFMAHLAVGLLSLIILIPVLIIGAFLVIVTSAMAERIIVLKNRPVLDSIADGFTLWTSNLGPTVLYSLIYLGISIGVGLGTLVIFMFVAMPFIAIGFVNLLLALLLGIPVALLVLLVINGFTGSAMHLMTTEFYFQLVGRSEGLAPHVADSEPITPSPSAPPDSI
jgi:hypothetical protein